MSSIIRTRTLNGSLTTGMEAGHHSMEAVMIVMAVFAARAMQVVAKLATLAEYSIELSYLFSRLANSVRF